MQGMNKGIMNKRAGRYIRIDLDIPAFFLLTVTICNPAKAQKAVAYIPLLFNCKKRSSVNSNGFAIHRQEHSAPYIGGCREQENYIAFSS